MPRKDLDQNNLGIDEDWDGNNAAFRCPCCNKVFIVSGFRTYDGIKGVRKCPNPNCKKSTGRIDIKGREASLEW